MMGIFQRLAGPHTFWWGVSLLLHLSVIGGLLLLSSHLPPDAPGAVQVVLVDGLEGGAGTGPAGGGGDDNGDSVSAGRGSEGVGGEVRSTPGSTEERFRRTVGQKGQVPARVPNPSTRPKGTQVAKRPTRKMMRSPSPTEGTDTPARFASGVSPVFSELSVDPAPPSPSPLARAVPLRPLQRRASSSGSEQSHFDEVPEEDREISPRPEGEGEDSKLAEALSSLGGTGEGSSASAGNDKGFYTSLGLQGGSGGGRGGGYGPGIGTGRGPGAGVGSGGGMNWILHLLQRINNAKYYPLKARRMGMEGTTEVQFRITGDGGVEDVTIVKSSGFIILDRASLETIKRAAPLPAVPGTFRIPLSYRLDER